MDVLLHHDTTDRNILSRFTIVIQVSLSRGSSRRFLTKNRPDINNATMANDEHIDWLRKLYDVQQDVRKQLVDAGRESARTFDKAVLAFGSVAFGSSIAFLKDLAPTPAPETLWLLRASWMLFSTGLLANLLSFLFSCHACDFEIKRGKEALDEQGRKLLEKLDEKPEGVRGPKLGRNQWSAAVYFCNYLCIACLILGLYSWSCFALKNL